MNAMRAVLFFLVLAASACDKAEPKHQSNPVAPTLAAPQKVGGEAPAGAEAQAEMRAAPEAKVQVTGSTQVTPPGPELGKVAPDFTLKDLDGKEVNLAGLKGKTVVLEWYNPDCPFVVKQHGEGPLKSMAKDVVNDKVVWLAINSGAPGKQGHGVERNRASVAEYGVAHPILLDEDGAVGRAYGARTTPHMFVVAPDGTLAYKGAIDNAPMGKVPESGLVNHVGEALADIAAGRPVKVAETKAYGCKVKYSD